MADTDTRALAKKLLEYADRTTGYIYEDEVAVLRAAAAALASAPDAARPAEALRCEKCGSADIHTAWHGEGANHRTRRFQPCRKYGEDSGKPDAEHLHRTCRGCHFVWTDTVLAAAGGDTPEEPKT